MSDIKKFGDCSYGYDGRHFELDNYCPQCGTICYIEPQQITFIGQLSKQTQMPRIYVVGVQSPGTITDFNAQEHMKPKYTLDTYAVNFSCPVRNNKSIGIFKEITGDNPTVAHDLQFIGYFPQPKKNPAIPETIAEISHAFINIYTQAVNAHLLELDEISGFGLRKAAEFLVKDYLIHETDDEEKERIGKLQFNQAIAELNDPELQTLFDGIRHGGNDETHYMRKYDFEYMELLEFVECALIRLDTR